VARADLGSAGALRPVLRTLFRSVYATLLDLWLGGPLDEVLGQHFERLAVLSPCPPAESDRIMYQCDARCPQKRQHKGILGGKAGARAVAGKPGYSPSPTSDESKGTAPNRSNASLSPTPTIRAGEREMRKIFA